MKKVLLATLVAAMLLCSMIGCKGEDKKPPVTTTPEVTTPSTTTDGSGTTNPGDDTTGDSTEVYVPNPYGVGAFVSTASDSNFDYEIYENGAVVSAYKGSETAVTLPTAIGDKTVYGVANNAFVNSSVKSVVVPAGYTVIGESAFMGAKELTSIQLPASITELRADAFKYCEKLTAVSIPATVTKIGEKLFYGCSSLTTVNIPTGVTTDEATTVTAIPDSMFFGCTALKSIVIPSTIKVVGANAFYFCTSLETAVLPESVTTVSANAFYNCYSLKEVAFPAELSNIGNSAYFGCSSIKKLTFPASLTNIGNGVFSGCTALTEVNFAAPVYDEEGVITNALKLGTATFAGCTSLTSFELPATVNLIPAGLFNGCTALETVILSNAANKIGDYAFAGTALKSFNVPETVLNIGSRAFRGCASLESVNIHGAVTTLGTYAFENCTALKSISIPSSVKAIPEGVCSGCTSLSSVKLSNGTTNIATLAFYGCPKLKTVELPGTITDIKRYAFAFAKGEAPFEVILPSGETEIQILPTDYAVDKTFVLYGFTGTVSDDYSKENGLQFVATGNKGENAFADFEYVISEIQVPTKITDENGQLVDTVVTQKVVTFNKYLGTKPAVVIPTTINDAIAYRIGDNCFKNADFITSVSVPGTVISVGNNAFNGCVALNKITLPEGIESYGKYAFAGTLIKEFVVDAATVIPEGMFQNCTKLEKFDIKYKANSGLATTEIGAYAFENCPIAKFTIPETVTSIGNGAFLGCVNLKSLDVPDSVKNIGAYALGFVKVNGAYKLIADHTYDVVTEKPVLDAEGNPVLDAEGNPTKETITETFKYEFSMGYFDGAISENYVKNSKVEGRLLGNTGETPFKSFMFEEIKDANGVAVAYAIKLCLNSTATEIVVPTSYNGLPVTKIATGAFSNKGTVEKIVIGANITTICEKSFNGCKKLTSCEILGNNVEFPDSVSPWYALTKSCVIYVNAGSKTQENINAISGNNRYTVLEFGQSLE